ncbi:YbaK/EbsC family protein, partial [Eubacterium aggregans]
MSVEKVKQYLSRFGKDGDVLILTESTATVQLAAEAINVEPGQIAKSLTFRNGDGCILVVMSGDARVDN